MMLSITKFFVLLFVTNVCFAGVPNQVTLGDVVYYKSDQNDFGNHKSAEYIQKGETSSNWTSKFAIHYFMNEKDPVQFAKAQNGNDDHIQYIDDNKNNILQTFDTLVPVNNTDGPYIFQQNAWRFEKLNYDKGIMSIEYATRKSVPSQTSPQALQSINPQILNEMQTMQIERYEF